MLKKYIRPFAYLSVIALSLSFVISCEEDFTDINSSIATNNQFSTNDTILEVQIVGKDVERVRADGIDLGTSGQLGVLGQYLLGVYDNNNYKKIEASIISQLQIPIADSLQIPSYGADTTVVTSFDGVLLKIPYQATLNETTSSGPDFTLDSIIGDQNTPFTLNVFRLSTFLNTLDPTNPAVQNSFSSDHVYDVFSEKLNTVDNIQFTPNRRDTIQVIERRLSTGVFYENDTIKYDNSNPYIAIPLKSDRIKELFFDEYGTSNFSSQDAFNDYFRGIKIQAEGNNGSLMSLDLNSTTAEPMIEIYYTHTVFVSGGTVVIDTIKKRNVFLLSGVRNSEYKMTNAVQSPTSNQFTIQGTAGANAQVKIFGDDLDNNGVSDALDILRTKDWLINDATLTFYVDKDVVGFDTISTPSRLFLFRDGLTSANVEQQTQILDYVTESNQVGGFLSLDDTRRPDMYTFNITDYVSELVLGTFNTKDLLGLKAFNPTDLPATSEDVVIKKYSWNPKAVMLLNQELLNGARRAQLKISYSKKTD
tara:strand:+ start:42396 stop:43997 length:1602 start_codon:yes stop_codon:yes gene_type:complete